MNFLRLHWFDIGLVLAALVAGVVALNRFNPISLLLWISLISLFVHQFEEYRYPGYFPGMLNTVMFSSRQPDRYPLNTNSALIINVVTGWLSYFLAAVFSEKAIWLGIGAMLISVSNFFVHTFVFNIRGRTRYNPGMFTAIVLFVPIAAYFVYLVVQSRSATPIDWILGIILGIILNFVGIVKVMDWLKDQNTRYIFPKRSLLPDQRAPN